MSEGQREAKGKRATVCLSLYDQYKREEQKCQASERRRGQRGERESLAEISLSEQERTMPYAVCNSELQCDASVITIEMNNRNPSDSCLSHGPCSLP